MSHDFLDDLVHGERESLVPPAGAKKKTWKQVTRSVAIGAPVSAWPTGKAIGSKLSLSWGKGLLVVVLGATAAVGVWKVAGGGGAEPTHVAAKADAPEEAPAVAKRRSGSRTPATQPEEPAAAVEDERPSLPVEPAPEVQAATPVQTVTAIPAKRRPSEGSPTPEPAAAEPAPAASALAEEARLLTRARRELSGGSASAALTALAEHARRFPQGQLLEERLALSARASCKAGDLERGRREAATLRERFPSSSQLPRVTKACDDP